MRRRHVLRIVTGLLIAGGLWAAWWQGAARPILRLDPTAVDFGAVARRATLTVLVRNDGRAPLRILGVSSSCGCTTATISASEVPGRSTAQLSVTFDPAAHGSEPGPARHSVYLRTNDSRAPEAEVEVRAVVLKASP